MIAPIQLIGVFFALGMLFLAYLHFKKKELLVIDFLVWFLVWIVFIVVVIFPKSVSIILQPLSIQGTLWFLTIAAILFLIVLVFYLHYTVRKTQRQLRMLVKKLALKNGRKTRK